MYHKTRLVGFQVFFLATLMLPILPLSSKELVAEQLGLATITRFYGDVKILSNPAPRPTGPGPHVLFNGRHYQLRQAEIGASLKAEDVVQTGAGARARIVYATGDQMTVTASTSYRMIVEGESGVKKATVDLIFGKVRAMIRQRAPDQEPLELRTSSMVMGVRGTDFFVTARNEAGSSELTVLRGAVAVLSPEGEGEALEVPAGYSLRAGGDEAVESESAFQVRRTNKEDVAAISQLSRVEPPSAEDLAKSPAQALVQGLEELALLKLKEDIRQHQPELYQKLQQIPSEDLMDTDLVQAITTREAYESAPAKPEKGDKSRSFDLDSFGDDVYKRYFNY